MTYEVSYSLSKWPASGYEGDAAFYDVFGIERFLDRFNTTENQGLFQMFQSHFTEENRDQAMKDFARMNIYIADSNVVKTEEADDYTPNQLVSDIGGQLGLWVGISIITLAEVFELLVEVCRFVGKRPQRQKGCKRDWSKTSHQLSSTRRKCACANNYADYQRESLQARDRLHSDSHFGSNNHINNHNSPVVTSSRGGRFYSFEHQDNCESCDCDGTSNHIGPQETVF